MKKIDSTEKQVLILTAGSIPAELIIDFGKIPSGLIPINGEPVIFKTIDNLILGGFTEFNITIGYKSKKIKEILLYRYKNNIKLNFIQVDYKKPPGNSIIEALKKIHGKRLLVILGDTIVEKTTLEDINSNKDFVIGSEKFTDSTNWCIVKTKNKKVEQFFDKKRDIKSKKGFQALIGIYFFNNLPLLQKIIQTKSFIEKVEISQILKKYNKSKPITVINSKQWFDVGHKNNYEISKKKLLQSRFFNYIELDQKNGIVTKKSENKKKLLQEMNWYKNVPIEIKSKIPKIISSNKTEPSIIMEHVNAPTLAEIWLYGDVNIQAWKRILNELKNIIQNLLRRKNNVTKQEYEEIYLLKTQNRINELRKTNQIFKNLLNKENIVINGKTYENWEKLKPKIVKKISCIYSEKDNCFIHGDLCFSNILYSLRKNESKLIDPRGKWGKGSYGDIKYDIAKLRHSIIGGYDAVNHKLFSVNLNDEKIDLIIYQPTIYKKFSIVFDQWVEKNWNITNIKFIEGLLFISMLPLHQESLEKQIAFYAIGIQRLNEVLND